MHRARAPLYGCLITLVLHHRVFRVRRTASGDNLSFRFKEYPTGRTIYRIGLSRSFLHSLTRPTKLALPASPGGEKLKCPFFIYHNLGMQEHKATGYNRPPCVLAICTYPTSKASCPFYVPSDFSLAFLTIFSTALFASSTIFLQF